MIDLRLKVAALLVQWVTRFAVSPCSWVSFLSFWCSSRFHASALDVLSRPDAFSPKSLPPFYSALLSAWHLVGAAFSCHHSSIVIAYLPPYHVAPVSSISSKSTYLFLLSEDRPTPHCVDKFFLQFSTRYWPLTWSQLFFFKLDCPVIDLNWKVAQGVLYTADRLVGFGYSVDPSCFCNSAPECPSHLFFSCPLTHSVLSWLQSLFYVLIFLPVFSLS